MKVASTNAPSKYWTRPCMLEVKMNGTNKLCLVDTGCGQTMVPPECAKGLRLKKTDQVYTNASDDPMKVLGTVNLPIRLEERIADVEAVVSPDCDEPLLGHDWLEKYKAIIVVHEGTISIEGKKYKLMPRLREPCICRVVTTETLEIPARSTAIVGSTLRICNIRAKTPRPVYEDWMVESHEVAKGVFVGRTLLPRKSDDLPVSVVNTTNETVTIEGGATIAEAVKVNVPEEQCEVAEAPKRKKHRDYSHLKPLLEGVSRDMTSLEKSQLWELLKTYADVFSCGKHDMGRTTLVSHRIDTGDAQPVRQKLRKQAWAHQDIIKSEREELSRTDVVQEFNGPWCSNVVIVTKKDGTPRFCIDYRKLNELTKKDAYPLPSIEVCLDALAGSRYFSTFDLRSGYHQIPMEESSIEKTAFVTREGTFAFNVMPFGLCNAGATFQRLMDLLMAGITYKICLVYLDDIIIFSRDLKEHMDRCKIVFHRLRDAGLKLKVSKCNMVRDHVQFLGHIVSREGIATDPDKIQKVKEWPRPKSVHDIKSFYGLCSYYRKFVKDFSKVAAPLTSLMKIENKFVWDEECEVAFVELKKRLTESPILALPRQQGRFILDTDASDRAIGAVLSQEQDGLERVVAYGSRALTKEEKNYCVTRRELLAIIEFLKKYRQYLLGRKFSIRTDHAALTWMRRTPEPIGQQARWISLCDEYDFDIEHRAGKLHGNADAMSRMPCPEECRQCISKKSNERISSIRPRPCVQEHTALDYGDHAVATATDEDISLRHVKKWLQEKLRPSWESIRGHNAEVKALMKEWDKLSLRNGVIYRSWHDEEGVAVRFQKVLPYKYRRDFVRMIHSGMNGGHTGERKTRHGVQIRAYWLSWKETIHQEIRSCPECQKYHRGKVPKQAELQKMTMGAPWERLGIDITGPFPKSARGNRFIVTMIDHFTKWAEAVPIPNHEATTVSRILLEQIITRFGVPRQILSDRGSEFESQLFKELCRVLGIDKIRTTAYKPSTNGMIERLHRSMNSMIGKVVDFQQRYWDEQVPVIMAAYRASRHESTGFSPNYLMFGRELTMPADIISGVPEELKKYYSSENEYVANLQEKLRLIYEKTRVALGKVAERNKNYYDIGVKSREFETGQWVLYYLPKATQGRSIKLEKLFTGPFLIVRKYSSILYGIQASRKSQIKTVHIDKLKQWFGDTPQTWLKQENDNVAVDLNTQLLDNTDDTTTDGQSRGGKDIIDRGSTPLVAVRLDAESIVADVNKPVNSLIMRPCTVRLQRLSESRGELQDSRGTRETDTNKSRSASESRGSVPTTTIESTESRGAIDRPYRPPATRAKVAARRRMTVPDSPPPRKLPARDSRRKLSSCHRNFPVYKVARVQESSYPFPESAQRTLVETNIERMPKKVKPESVVEEKSQNKKVAERILCPFEGCGHEKSFKNLYNMNDHVKIKHGGTYERDLQGELIFYAAPEDRVAVWKAMYEAKKAKDVQCRQNKKTPAVDENDNTVSRRRTKKSRGATESTVADIVPEQESQPFVAKASDEEETDTQDDTTTPKKRRINPNATATVTSAEVAEADQSQQSDGSDEAADAVAGLLMIDEKILAAAELSQKDKYQIVAEQSKTPPLPMNVSEIHLSTRTVAEVVADLKPSTSATEDESQEHVTDVVQPKRRTATTTSEGRLKAKFAEPQPFPSKRKACTATFPVTKKTKEVAASEERINTIAVPRPTAEFHQRVLELGKWLVGQVAVWNTIDRTREVMEYAQLSRRDAGNVLVAFMEGFRAAAVASRSQPRDVADPTTHMRTMGSVMRTFTAISCCGPARIDPMSRWGIAGVSTFLIESVADNLAMFMPPFSQLDVTRLLEFHAPNISLNVMMEVAEVITSACQQAARFLLAHSGRSATFRGTEEGVFTNEIYFESWHVQSTWLLSVFRPAAVAAVATTSQNPVAAAGESQ